MIAAALIAIDITIFALMVNNVELDSFLRYGILPISSPRSAMSAASIATSLPIDPIATLTSAVLSAGASFTPSPIIHTFLPSLLSFSIHESFSSGSKLPNTLPIPTCPAK